MPQQTIASPAYEIRSSGIHGTGVFAARAIQCGERILEYRGERIDKAESERRGLALMERAKRSGGAAVYIFALDQEWDLDGASTENEARLINHSCDPNTEVWNEENRLWIDARRAIGQGEELTFNYGFGFETWTEHPCRCGSARCVGYIVTEELWPALRRAIGQREARRARAQAAGRLARVSPRRLRTAGTQTVPTP